MLMMLQDMSAAKVSAALASEVNDGGEEVAEGRIKRMAPAEEDSRAAVDAAESW